LNYSLADLNSILASKSLPVIWPVSHCQTSSRRERYVVDLAQFIGVDVIGKCERKGWKHNWFPKFGKKYKFYPSFEKTRFVKIILQKKFLKLFKFKAKYLHFFCKVNRRIFVLF